MNGNRYIQLAEVNDNQRNRKLKNIGYAALLVFVWSMVIFNLTIFALMN